jgi:hypothetical protein
MQIFDFKNLQTNGFVVVKNFLNTNDIEKLKSNFDRSYTQEKQNKNYNTVPSLAPHDLDHLIYALLDKIKKETDISVDWITPNGLWFDTAEVEFNWHQDHEPYWWSQDSYNHLNFWIPVVKPDPTSSGISVVPFDQLKLVDNNLTMSRIIKKGAKLFTVDADGTNVQDDDTGERFRLNIDISTVAVAPELSAGDLLILRGDSVHKTQDTQSNRLALSIRCYNSESVLTREKFVQGSRVKRNMIGKNLSTYQILIDRFIHQGNKTIPLSELLTRFAQQQKFSSHQDNK